MIFQISFEVGADKRDSMERALTDLQNTFPGSTLTTRPAAGPKMGAPIDEASPVAASLREQLSGCPEIRGVELVPQDVGVAVNVSYTGELSTEALRKIFEGAGLEVPIIVHRANPAAEREG